MSKITVWPNGDIIEIDENTTILQALLNKGLYVKSSCGGHASCSDCIIKIKEGTDNLTTPPFEEVQLLGNVFHITKERLACQCKVTGDVEVDLSSHDRVADQARQKLKSNNFKKGSPTKVRKKEEVDQIIDERKQSREEKDANKDDWQNHWEKEKPQGQKKLGGGRRPRPFNYEKPERSNELPRPQEEVAKVDNANRKDFRKERKK